MLKPRPIQDYHHGDVYALSQAKPRPVTIIQCIDCWVRFWRPTPGALHRCADATYTEMTEQ